MEMPRWVFVEFTNVKFRNAEIVQRIEAGSLNMPIMESRIKAIEYEYTHTENPHHFQVECAQRLWQQTKASAASRSIAPRTKQCIYACNTKMRSEMQKRAICPMANVSACCECVRLRLAGESEQRHSFIHITFHVLSA